MHVLAIHGSPRENGNTARQLRHVLGELEAAGVTTETIRLSGRIQRGCTACGQCGVRKDRRCVIDGDVVNECVEKMVRADGILIGSPVYFADVTAETKALIDRAGYVGLANGGLFARKIGAAVAVHRRGGAVNVVDSINHVFLMSRMIVPGSTYWNFGVGREREEVATDEEAVQNMHDLGETIAWLVKSLARS